MKISFWALKDGKYFLLNNWTKNKRNMLFRNMVQNAKVLKKGMWLRNMLSYKKSTFFPISWLKWSLHELGKSCGSFILNSIFLGYMPFLSYIFEKVNFMPILKIDFISECSLRHKISTNVNPICLPISKPKKLFNDIRDISLEGITITGLLKLNHTF